MRESRKRIFWTVLAMTALVLAGTPVSAQAPLRVGDVHAIRIDSRAASDVESADTGTGKRYTIHHPGATYIALHFADFDLAPGDSVVVSDPDGRQSTTLTGRGKMDAGTFWAQHVKGDTAVLDLVTRGEKLGKGFVIDSYAAGFKDLGTAGDTEAICGTDDKRNAVCYQSSNPTEYARGRAVARLLIQGASLCTGWLASANNHLITNNHCIGTSSAALNTDYEFMSEAPTCSSSNCQLCYPGAIISGATFVSTNASLDYTLVRITSGNPAGTYGFLQIDNRDAVVGEQIYIPQHPGGRAKEFGIASTADTGGVCRVSTISAAPCSGTGFNDVGYQCDTEGGSSGSPVLATSSHRVIALHHCANCPNRGVPIDLICAQICSTLGCVSNADCNDSNACTTDACSSGSCTNTPITACSSGDGCCPAGCTSSTDTDCPSCSPQGASCTTNSQCCSNNCKGKTGRKTCR